MNIGQTLYVTDRQSWRAWLRKNYNRKSEIWLIFYKLSSGKKRIPYNDSVEEALCYGWIDSIVKPIDEKKFAQRFSPRRPGSQLSETNRERVRRMIRGRKMTATGLAAIKHVYQHGEKPRRVIVAADIRKAGIFGLVGKQALVELKKLTEKNRFIPGLRSWVGFEQGIVTYDRQERAGGEPKQSFKRLIKYALDAIFSFSYKPLKMMTAMGIFISTIGFALACFFILRRLLGIEIAQTGFTTLVTLVLFLGGGPADRYRAAGRVSCEDLR